MNQVALATPWMTYYREMVALFAGDENVNVVFDSANYEIRLYVNDSLKAQALQEIVPNRVKFGNVTLTVKVYPENGVEGYKGDALTAIELMKAAFKDNPKVVTVMDIPVVDNASFVYVIFKAEVVQFQNDNLSSPYGLQSMLYEEIAKDVLTPPGGAFFCTERKNVYEGAQLVL